MGKPADLLQGTLDLLILRRVPPEPLHGWAIAKRIEQVSGNALKVTQGSLYPALHRLEQHGWLHAKWAPADSGREAEFYSLSRAGRARLEAELRQWKRLSSTVGLVLKLA